MKQFVAAAVVCSVLAGCAQEKPKSGQGGVEVNAPGVNVKVGPDGATDVKAPGTGVKVDPKKP